MTNSSPLANYLSEAFNLPSTNQITGIERHSIAPSFLAYLASLEQVSKVSPEVAKSIVNELSDQRSSLKMIASENFSSLAVQLAQGNLLTDKYAEGYPYHRFYAGCDNVDEIEGRTVDIAKEIFCAEHAYVQPHSGADANLVAYWAILATRIQEPFMEDTAHSDLSKLNSSEWRELRVSLGNQRLLGMDYYSGGHLTHGYRQNVSSRMFEVQTYQVDRETRLLDYERIRDQAKSFKPLILLAGYSAYPRKINFKIFREIADEVGAVFMVDMAHFSGLVAGNVFEDDYDPVQHADVVTTTTHKTLRGPRGGMVLSTKEFSDQVDKGCPLVLGGPLPHVIAAKAVAMQEVNTDDFKSYARRIVENASALAQGFVDEGMNVVTGGTDNHLMLVDVTEFGITGRQGESVVREADITLNRNTLPYDANGPWYTSGLRLGTPALTTLGMGVSEMKEIASITKTVLESTKPRRISKGKNVGSLSKARYVVDDGVLNDAKSRVSILLKKFKLYPEIDLEYLKKVFS